jgi:hypothetical protein
MSDEVRGSKPKRAGKRSFLIAIFAFLVVVVLITTFLLVSGSEKNERGIKSDLISGTASDLIIDQTDMGADWNASTIDTNIRHNTGDLFSQDITSAAGRYFNQFNSTGHLEYHVEVGLFVFNTTDSATAYYDLITKIDPSLDTSPVLLANVSVGDGGIILDGPHITLGHEAKWMYFTDRNVVCGMSYHHLTTYETLPDSYLVDLAKKQEARFP